MTPTETVADPPPATLPSNIRVEIARQDITVLALCDALGMSQPTFHRRMRFPGEWRYGELVRLAAILRVPVRTLVP